MSEVIHVKSVSKLHDYLNLPRPINPLITVISHIEFQGKVKSNTTYASELYNISLKQGTECAMKYGQSSYDFDDGSLVFLAPGQKALVKDVEVDPDATGWTIAFHPDLIRQSELGRNMEQYTFFNYESNESLHLSEKDIKVFTGISEKIKHEVSLKMDRHTQSLLRANLNLFLVYCVRFYDRQFYVRSDINRKYVDRFEKLLNRYYESSRPLDAGLPTVQYCGQQLGLSPYYLSDLLKRETGKTALEIIHLFLIDKAKSLILENNLNMTQISCVLGFEYPQHFSKLFKAKVGMTPRAFKASLNTKH